MISSRFTVLLVVLACPSIALHARSDTTRVEGTVEFPVPDQGSAAPTIYTIVEEMPQFPGGEVAMYRFLAENILFPQEATMLGVSGTVYMTFVVREDGSLTDFAFQRRLFHLLDQEAMRVLRLMPDRIPGKREGLTCCVQYDLPVKFTSKVMDKQGQMVTAPPSKPIGGGPSWTLTPLYPGGDVALQEALIQALDLPTGTCKRTGSVDLEVINDRDGSVKSASVIGGTSACDELAMDAVRRIRNWRPGIVNGTAVEMPITVKVPIRKAK